MCVSTVAPINPCKSQTMPYITESYPASTTHVCAEY